MVKINLNIEKKHLFILVIFLSLFTIALVIAGNPSTKPNPGHASNEVMVNVSGVDKTLQAAIDDGSLSLGGAVYESSWFAVSYYTTYPITHNLGKLPSSVLVLYSASPDGSNPIVVDNVRGDYVLGATISSLTSTSLSITTGRWVILYNVNQGTEIYPDTGYYKIIVKA